MLVLPDAGLGEQEISIQTGHTKIIIQINTTLYPLGQLLFTTLLFTIFYLQLKSPLSKIGFFFGQHLKPINAEIQ